ncbi:bZIP transcription factor [Maridesulfovibrio sp.]|uniref:bZIP transcription factor n=1 Tax=Maridesulfovibrio sp. TaxID=2795000 RepID=UPI002A187744|nr:bZIP transcription factor [Maridesulfovibrio sp.]
MGRESKILKSTFWITLLTTLLYAAPALASNGTLNGLNPTDQQVYDDALTLLFKTFILATFIEVSFTTLFDWRFFIKHTYNKGWKTPIIVITLFIFCKSAELDIVQKLINILFGNGHSVNANIDFFLTSMLLAGGSGSMNTLFKKLKLRDPKQRENRFLEAQEEDNLKSENERLKEEIRQLKGETEATSDLPEGGA